MKEHKSIYLHESICAQIKQMTKGLSCNQISMPQGLKQSRQVGMIVPYCYFSLRGTQRNVNKFGKDSLDLKSYTVKTRHQETRLLKSDCPVSYE